MTAVVPVQAVLKCALLYITPATATDTRKNEDNGLHTMGDQYFSTSYISSPLKDAYANLSLVRHLPECQPANPNALVIPRAGGEILLVHSTWYVQACSSRCG